MVEAAGAEVQQTQSSRVHFDEDVFVLDVAVDYPGLMHLNEHVDHLPEEVPGLGLRQRATLRYVVEEVAAGRRPFQDQNEAVAVLEEVQQLHNAGNVRQFLQEANLHWQVLPVDVHPLGHS